MATDSPNCPSTSSPAVIRVDNSVAVVISLHVVPDNSETCAVFLTRDVTTAYLSDIATAVPLYA